jgi:tripeptidyl-peptidase-1
LTEISCSSVTGGLITSGGGFSALYSRPSWQNKAIKDYFDYVQGKTDKPVSGYARNGRGYPDVSALGNNYLLLIGKISNSGLFFLFIIIVC